MADLPLSKLFANRQNLELVLDSLPDPVLVHDVERFVNRAAERLLGLSRAEVLGRDCWSVLRGGVCGSRCAFCPGCDKNVGLQEYPLVVTSSSGDRHRVQMTIIPMKDDEGETVGVVAYARDVTEVEALRSAVRREHSFSGLVGRHHLMQEVYRLIREVAPTRAPVLVQGESGTGKELVARAIHGESDRGGRPFVAINCGALPEPLLESELFGHVRGAFTGAIRDKKGRFEQADGGTLLLDEVADLPLSMQVKLLRVLETGQFERVGGERSLRVDVRVVSATNQDLRALVADGAFRQDLFFRLAVVPIHLPPLRERRTDILLLADHLLARLSGQEGRSTPVLADSAAAVLLDYHFPGNVRELLNILQFAMVKANGDVIEREHLPPEVREPGLELRRPGVIPGAGSGVGSGGDARAQSKGDGSGAGVATAQPGDLPAVPPARRGRRPKLTRDQVIAAGADGREPGGRGPPARCGPGDPVPTHVGPGAGR